MDSGSYSNVRRGAMPASSTTQAASSYKANVNRTKTRKWVEAKVQNYDGDDWGNDYDDYDDGNDQYNEPEPPPPPTTRLTGLRQPGQIGHQLPSSRTFSQPSTSTLPSNVDSRPFGPSALRSPSEPPSLHVQTQSTTPVTTLPSYTVESAHPATVSPPRSTVPSGPYTAGPASTPSRFPPRKSSMGHLDRPNIDDKMAPKPDSRPDSSSDKVPDVDQQSTSPSRASAPTIKALPFVRPADIYKRIGEEKEKERLSMESGRPSMDSVLGRNEGTASPTQLRSSGEQRRRTSLESHDGSEPPRARKSSLAPVAERKSEYGMDGFLMRALTSETPAIYEPTMPNPELSRSQGGLTDEAKIDLMKSRRFSTSPQLPSLTRMSDFSDDFFSNPNGYGSKDNEGLTTVPVESTRRQPSYTSEDANPGENLVSITDKRTNVTKEGAMETHHLQPNSTRPKLPGGWVSESTSIPVPSEQPTPLGTQDVGRTESDVELSKKHLATELASLASSIGTSEHTSHTNTANGARAFGSATGQHSDSITPGTLDTSGHYPTIQSLPPLKMEKSVGPASPTTGDKSQQMQTSLTAHSTTAADTDPEFSPTAPLNTTRALAGNPNVVLPTANQRKSTISTIETTSPEKESDILREEIIKSLSPAPISPSPGELLGSNTGPSPGDWTRESTYLSGVYDDYLSLSEEKSLQEVSQAAKQSTMEKNSTPEPQYASVSQPAPLEPVQSTVSTIPTKLRRFSWQQEPEEVTTSPVESKPVAPVLLQEPSVHSQSGTDAVLNNKTTRAASPVSDSLQADIGATGSISHQVSQVSSRAPEDSLATFEPPSPISIVATRGPKPGSDELNIARLSLADEKEKVLIGDVQSTTSSASDQHPALSKAPEQEEEGLAPVIPAVLPVPDVSPAQPTLAPTPFREILNLASYEERVQKFDETREQFYIMESGLSNWLTYLQSQPEHASDVSMGNTNSLLSKPGAPPAFAGVPGVPQALSKTSAAAANPRRSSIGNMQQLMAGQSGSFGASSAQVGTKSKELLHAAGVFGNKGMKSGMKLFNKGKNKLRR
ncbi:hypothetical protein GGS24DRAFT_467118 [Hypoxylon argillaceum]|nr:hypothetical protein GGS24DRAFT_467118 [Hypoxylon argillaceum]